MTEELEGFRRAQRLAYESALSIGKELKEGWTEKRAASLIDTYLRDHGVKSVFHKSFAWFGDRTRFQDFKTPFDFLPSERRLESTDVVILDTAPVLDGYCADIGYTMSLEPHAELERAKEALLVFREELKAHFASALSTKEIWHRVDRDLRDRGYDNIHTFYPFHALGHRLRRLPHKRWAGLNLPIPFGLQAVLSIAAHGFLPEILGPRLRAPKKGLWAIEPHLGGRGFGAKFEELLVVEDDQVRWLDDEVPHVRRL